MKVSDIQIGKKISTHLYQYEEVIEPEDFLMALRYLAVRGKKFSCNYGNHMIFYTDSNTVTRAEFDYVYEHSEGNYHHLLDCYTREDLVNRVGSAFRIVSTTTKAEIVQTILSNKNLIYRFFKKEFIEHHCTPWRSYRQERAFLTAASDPGKKLAFHKGYCTRPLSGKRFLQYWILGSRYASPDPGPDFSTGICGDCVTINLKDHDKKILKTIQQYLATQNPHNGIDLHCEHRSLETEDLNIKEIDTMDYPPGIFELTEYFGTRKGSKYKTFSHGLHQRTNHETVRKYLGTSFVIAVDSSTLYSGTAHPKELFEMLAWHLKIEYLRDKKILCKVTEQKTPETVTALWDLMTQTNWPGRFCFIEI
jgi:hypothetical protein